MLTCAKCKLLDSHIERLELRIKELEDRLNTNSGNSGLPPSGDFKKKKQKQKKQSRVATGRSPGGQPGHKGHYRSLAEHPDRIITVSFPEYCECGGEVIGNKAKPQRIQKVELPEIRPEVTEYRLLSGRCKCCGKKVAGKLPAGVTADLLGDHTKAVITMLTGHYKNSRREVLSMMKDIFNVNISLGLIPKTEARVSARCEGAYGNLEDTLAEEALAQMDETVNNYRGHKGWTWIFATACMTILKWRDSRGKKVLQEILPEYHGYVVSDRYAAYNHFDARNRQVCWAHLLRNFEKFAGSSFPEVREFGKLLVFYTSRLFAIYRGYRRQVLDRTYFIRHVKKIRRRLYKYLHGISAQSESEYIRRQANNILKCEDMMWCFLQDIENIPLTNNHAEQEIRRFVIHRKTSFFTWSKTGQEYLERMLSIIQTCKKRGLNPTTVLYDLIRGNIQTIPAAA